jgi:mRNA interferase MazF
MSSYRRGDVVLCRFPIPSENALVWKNRPGLVVSKDLNNKRLDDLIIAPCSSNISRRREPTQFFIRGKEIEHTGVRIPSVVRCEALMNLPKSIVSRRIGRASGLAMRKIDACLRDALSTGPGL